MDVAAPSSWPALLGQVAAGGALGTREIVFLSLWGGFSLLYGAYYRKEENPLIAALKVGALLLFVYAVILGFDWLASPVAPEQAITFGLSTPAGPGPRVPLLTYAFEVFVGVLVLLVIWHARRKFSTVGGLILSAWDRGHWYMLPAIFVLMTVGLLLVAAAASPVLSPFIYTLF